MKRATCNKHKAEPTPGAFIETSEVIIFLEEIKQLLYQNKPVVAFKRITNELKFLKEPKG